jgi:soluble lytic murein transglycosylase-like protein
LLGSRIKATSLGLALAGAGRSAGDRHADRNPGETPRLRGNDGPRVACVAAFAAALLIIYGLPSLAQAGAQKYEPLSDSVRTALSADIADGRPPKVQIPDIKARLAYLEWLGEMSERIKKRIPDYQTRRELLETIYYESKRAGLDPALMLGLIQVESGFRKFAISTAGARGLTQVMPFWAGLIGDGDAKKLFNMQVNVRFGCVVFRHYLDIEQGDYFRALGRYNGSLGRAEYPNMVLGAWKRWEYEPQLTPTLPALPAAVVRVN